MHCLMLGKQSILTGRRISETQKLIFKLKPRCFGTAVHNYTNYITLCTIYSRDKTSYDFCVTYKTMSKN